MGKHPAVLNASVVDVWLTGFLQEDLAGGDPTTEVLFGPEERGKAVIVAQSEGVLAGLPFALRLFSLLSDGVQIHRRVEDRAALHDGMVVAEVEGPVQALLGAERTALNLLMHLSGVATLTARFVEKARPYGVEILDTRKTLPGLRYFEKYATRVGGARNHRFHLGSGILLKDNHMALFRGSLREAVQTLRQRAPSTLQIEVEVETVQDALEAAEAGADILLLDNMTPDEVARVVEALKGKVLLEVSVGVTLEAVEAYARTGVDFISVGRITHSAPALSFSMEVV